MLLYSITVAAGFFLIALLIRIFRINFYSLAEDSVSLVNALLLKIDEDEKIKLVQQSNNKLILSLGKVLFSALLALAIGTIPLIFYMLLTDTGFHELDFSSLPSIISLTVGSTLGFIVPYKNKGNQSYSELSQLLHRLALNNYAVAEKLFRLEVKKMQKKGIHEKEEFVIVTGLARSGTTSLMNKLSENESFATLNYGNMPFITAPNLWKKFYRPKEGKKKERSHKDGIMIGLDSNEALEEFFFKMISNDSYINDDCLHEYILTEDQYTDYMKYQCLVRNYNNKIYLAKNNNYALRYRSMREHNDKFTLILMFRDPLKHAASLLEKHKYYVSLQEEDGFVLEYMNWLGHHEFGLNQKPFHFTQMTSNYGDDRCKLDYWLQIWINYYTYILSIEKTGVMFVDYDEYCMRPGEVLERIYQRAGIPSDLPKLSPYNNTRKAEIDCSENLKLKAGSIHNELKALC